VFSVASFFGTIRTVLPSTVAAFGASITVASFAAAALSGAGLRGLLCCYILLICHDFVVFLFRFRCSVAPGADVTSTIRRWEGSVVLHPRRAARPARVSSVSIFAVAGWMAGREDIFAPPEFIQLSRLFRSADKRMLPSPAKPGNVFHGAAMRAHCYRGCHIELPVPTLRIPIH
jgi:hypothetical protein